MNTSIALIVESSSLRLYFKNFCIVPLLTSTFRSNAVTFKIYAKVLSHNSILFLPFGLKM